MSETPRTDAEMIEENVEGVYCNSSFARQLERELSAAKTEQYALAKNFADMQERMFAAIAERDESGRALARYAQRLGEQVLATKQVEKERDAARECLREAVESLEFPPRVQVGARYRSMLDDMINRWRAAAGLDGK